MVSAAVSCPVFAGVVVSSADSSSVVRSLALFAVDGLVVETCDESGELDAQRFPLLLAMRGVWKYDANGENRSFDAGFVS